MKKMTIGDFISKYGHNNALSMLNAISEKPVKVRGKDDIYKYKKIEFEIPEEETLELMQHVNRQVKSAECPSNRKNKFYMLKHRYIKTMLDEGRVDRILESENLYHFYIGDYDFHQMKAMYKDVKVDGTEVYDPLAVKVEPYCEEDFRKCSIKMVFDISDIRRRIYLEKKSAMLPKPEEISGSVFDKELSHSDC